MRVVPSAGAFFSQWVDLNRGFDMTTGMTKLVAFENFYVLLMQVGEESWLVSSKFARMPPNMLLMISKYCNVMTQA